jgi:serine-type D-Ala-D-Ala carboxypeptidase (penicillin-binding protein 5/6)
MGENSIRDTALKLGYNKQMRLLIFKRALWLIVFAGLPLMAFVPFSNVHIPYVEAKNYVLMDFDSGQVLVQKDAHVRVPPASLTKLTTAYLVFENLQKGNLHLDDSIRVSKKAWRTGGSTMFLQPNLPVKVSQLISGLVVVSANDAAVVLAQRLAGSTDAFVKKMNALAKQLGMKDSHYNDVNGLPTPDHYSSAYDIALISYDILHRFPNDLHFFSQHSFTYNHITQANWNPLLKTDNSVDGLKTGHTKEAGFCLSATAKRNGRRLIAVVMGLKTREASAEAAETLLNYGYQVFKTHKVYNKNEKIATLQQLEGSPLEIGVGAAHNVYVTVPNGRYDKLNTEVQFMQTALPIDKGEKVGSLVFKLNGNVIKKVPLIALENMQKAGFFSRTYNHLKIGLRWFHGQFNRFVH